MDAKPRRRYLPRFSLRTLVILVLLAASGLGLWWRWEPWVVVLRLGGHRTPIGHVEYAKDGSKILTNSESELPFTGGKTPQEDLDETAVWDARSGAQLCRIEFGQAAVVGGYGSAELTADGRWVHKLYGHEVQRHALFDSASGQPVLPGQNEMQAQFLIFSEDEKQMVVQFPGKAPELWDMDKQSRRMVLDAGGLNVERGEFIPDEQRFVLGGAIDGEAFVAVFDASRGARQYLLKAPVEDPFVLLQGGRRLLCTLNGQLYSTVWTSIVKTPTDLYLPFVKGMGSVGCVLDLDRALVTETLPNTPWNFDCLRLGERLLVFTHDSYEVLDPDSLKVLSQFGGNPTYPFAISKEDKNILTCSAEYVSLEPGTPDSVDPSLVLECIESDIGTGKKLAHKEMIARSGEVFQSLAYTAGQRRATFSTWHRTVLWDAGTGANVVTFEGAGYPVPDGKRILLFRPGELLQIGDVDTGEILTTLEGTANAEAPDVSMAPDGNHILLLVGGRGNEAQVWERRRDEGPWGIAALPESWLTALFALLLVWSLVRDFRTLRKVAV